MESTNLTSPAEATNLYHKELFDRFYAAYYPAHYPLATAICIFGTLANTINVLVLTRSEMLGPTNLLLTGLSIAQLGLVLDYLLLLAYDKLLFSCIVGWRSFAWTFYKLINVNLNIVFHTVALTHTVLLAIFRYIAIKHPTTSRKFVNTNSARYSVVAIYLTIPIICTPVFFSTVIIEVPSVYLEERETCNRSTEVTYELNFSEDETLTKLPIWMFGTVFKLLPCIVIALFSFLLIGTLKRVEQRRRVLKGTTNGRSSSANAQKAQRNRVTIMLLLIVLLFVVVELPQGVLCFFVGIWGFDFAAAVYTNLGPLFEMLTLLYSSINFILYCTMSTQFQETFKSVFCGCCPPELSWESLRPRRLTRRKLDLMNRSSAVARKHESLTVLISNKQCAERRWRPQDENVIELDDGLTVPATKTTQYSEENGQLLFSKSQGSREGDVYL